ncbi:hypothetical protein C9426_30680 [Serratia sp. S1B]|nr:hypothetical protein C9426_30680 [Serratia sp. S1B]
MNKQQLLDYCLTKPGSEQDYQRDWQADRVRVAEKMFALIGEAYGRPVISLKCDPKLAEQLREQHAEIIPGYYLNKAHWNSIYLDGALPDLQFYQLIDISYQLVVAGLSKKKRQELGICIS